MTVFAREILKEVTLSTALAEKTTGVCFSTDKISIKAKVCFVDRRLVCINGLCPLNIKPELADSAPEVTIEINVGGGEEI